MFDQRLLTFLTIIETKNYTEAAKKLNLTQPAISQHIKHLEENYGTTLFYRNGKDLILTTSGEILLKYARRIQSLYIDLNRKIKDSKENKNNLVIGITHTSESSFAPEILANYSSVKNGTRIKIISDTIKNLYDKLYNFQIDMAIIEGKISGNKLSSVPLSTDSLVAVISNDNPLSKKKIISIDDLKREKLILRTSDSGTMALFASALDKIDVDVDDLNIVLEIDNVATIKDLVRKNLGISILPSSVTVSEMKKKTLTILPIENMNMVRETSLVYLKDNIDRGILEDIASIYRDKMQLLS